MKSITYTHNGSSAIGISLPWTRVKNNIDSIPIGFFSYIFEDKITELIGRAESAANLGGGLGWAGSITTIEGNKGYLIGSEGSLNGQGFSITINVDWLNDKASTYTGDQGDNAGLP